MQPVAATPKSHTAPTPAAPTAPQNTHTPQAPATPEEPEVYETTLKELESSNENDLLNKLRKNWINVVGKIKNPMIRTSFKDAKAVSITDNTLLLHFSTNFHLEKTSSSEAYSMIENAIEDAYKVKLGIKADLRKVDLEPTVKERDHSSIAENTPSVQSTNTTVEESPEDAMSVFESW